MSQGTPVSRTVLGENGDRRAEQMVGDLLRCLCDRLAESDRPVCSCCWVRSGAAAYTPQTCDSTSPDGDGMAWIRVRQRNFIPKSQQRGFGGVPCGSRWEERWAMEAGISRCWPGDEQDLDCEEMTVAAALGAWDEQLLFDAMVCCDGAQPYAIEPTRIYTRGPEGGCISAVIEFSAVPRKIRG